MSALHASVRSEDADFVLADEGSRNGIALAVRPSTPWPTRPASSSATS